MEEENGSPPVNQDLDLENKVLIYKVRPRPDEEVFEIIPKHIGKILTPLVGAFVLAIFGLIALFILFFTITLNITAIIIILGIFGIGIFLASLYTFSNWISYINSALIITNQRIIDVDQKHFFLRTVYETDLHTVRNVLSYYDEPFGHFLHYGWIKIERMNADPLVVHYLPMPKVIASQIMHYHNLVVHGGVATAHNFTAQRPADDMTPELQNLPHEAKEMAKQRGIPVKG